MEYIIYNKPNLYKNFKVNFLYTWVIDYLTNRRYIKFQNYYFLFYVYKIILKNNNYLIKYNCIKKIIKFKTFNIILKNLKYTKRIIKLTGVGYKLNLTNDRQIISIMMGYSHKIYIKFPVTISYVLSHNNTCLELSSYNYILLTSIIAKLKTLHKFDPYKGKGFKLIEELFVPKFYKK